MDISLLDATYRDDEGYAQIVVGKFTGKKPRLKITQAEFFAWPMEREKLVDFVGQHKEQDVYFSTCLFREKKRGAATATTTNVVYVDADDCKPSTFRVEPSIKVRTSPGKYQCYWVLDRSVRAVDAAQVARKMCKAHADDGCDPSGWITAKLMRVPGTHHGKDPANKHLVKQGAKKDHTYTLEEIDSEYADVEVDPVVHLEGTPMPTDLPDLVGVVERLNEELFDLYQHEPGDADDWSRLRWRLSLDMLRSGFSAPEVFVVVRATKFNKYERDGRPESDLWKEIDKAAATFTQEIGRFVDAEFVESAADEPYVEIEFMSEAERSSVGRTFVDDFEEWVNSRSPLASRKYARFVSFFVLANVYGSYGYIEPQMGPMALNLWGLMLGPSSELKKTTVVSLARTLQNEWDRRLPDNENGFDIGSDFTPEGLNVKLADRDGLVSFISRDEISGFFNEVLHKNYLAGSVERLTSLFDGEVMRTLRASASNSQQQSARVILNFLGLGITEHTAQVLHEGNFQSGFLPRYLWCVDDSPEWTPERETIGQGQTKSVAGEDDAVKDFCAEFGRGRRKWFKGVGQPVPVMLTEEALERINRFALDTKQAIIGTDIERLIEPSRLRLIWAVWKAAALIAMHERSDRIEMSHLLYVIRESEIWFSDLIRMARSVTMSDFELKAYAIYTYIDGLKQPVAPEKVYRKFSNYRKIEVDELTDSLRAQGRLIRSEGGFSTNE